MTISEHVAEKARKDQHFMRFLKELNLQRLYFKCNKQYPKTQETYTKSKSYFNARGNLILYALNFIGGNNVLKKIYPKLDWNLIDGEWYYKVSGQKTMKAMLKNIKQLQKYMT